jgi:integral membrane protein
VSLFKVVAVAEALSWLGLLLGMYFKYVSQSGDLGVKIFGPIHGGIFMVYVLLTLLVARTMRWGRWTVVIGLACSVPPFATLAFELWAARTGRLEFSPPRVADGQLSRAA